MRYRGLDVAISQAIYRDTISHDIVPPVSIDGCCYIECSLVCALRLRVLARPRIAARARRAAPRTLTEVRARRTTGPAAPIHLRRRPQRCPPPRPDPHWPRAPRPRRRFRLPSLVSCGPWKAHHSPPSVGSVPNARCIPPLAPDKLANRSWRPFTSRAAARCAHHSAHHHFPLQQMLVYHALGILHPAPAQLCVGGAVVRRNETGLRGDDTRRSVLSQGCDMSLYQRAFSSDSFLPSFLPPLATYMSGSEMTRSC